MTGKPIHELLTRLHLTVKDERQVSKAFIHRSFLNESPVRTESNERLEFLGDCIISFIVSEYLFTTYPTIHEGELTNLRSSIVRTGTLASAARTLTLGEYLSLSRGEEEGGGRNNASLLADTFEAFMGALYLDRGLSVVKDLLSEHLLPVLAEVIASKSYRDAKSQFQELVQETKKLSPIYRVMSEKGPDHAKVFTVAAFVEDIEYGVGTGKSKQEAEQSAAASALEKWQKTYYNR
jgi:ribonuclease III